MSQLSRCKLTRVRKTVEETVWKDELTTICRSEDLTVPPLVGCCRWNLDLPLLRIAVEGSDNPIILNQPCQRHFHLTSRSTTLSGDVQRSSVLFEVHRCVHLNRWSVVCGCVLHRGQRGEGWCVSSTLCRYEIRMGLLLVLSWAGV